jgi:hypothetical protein
MCLIKHHAIKMYGGVEMSGQLHALADSPPRKYPPRPVK